MVAVKRVPDGRPALANLGTLVVVLSLAGGRKGARYRIGNRFQVDEGLEGNNEPYEQEIVWGESPLAVYTMTFTDVEVGISKSGLASWKFTCNGDVLTQVGFYVVREDETNSLPLVCTSAIMVLGMQKERGHRDHLIAPIGPFVVERLGDGPVYRLKFRDFLGVFVLAGGEARTEYKVKSTLMVPDSATVFEKSAMDTKGITPNGSGLLWVQRFDIEADVRDEGALTFGLLIDGEPQRELVLPYVWGA